MTPSAFLRRAHIKQLLTHNTTTQNEKNKEVAVHQPYLLLPPEDMLSERKFSYASVKEEQGQGIPQSFESSLSSRDLEEVEWIAWPCSQWCKTKGLCSYHAGGTHDDYVRTRLEGYARSNPRKLEKILDELDKRRDAQKLFNLPDAKEITLVHPRPASFSLDVWREKVRDAVGTRDFTLDGTTDFTFDDTNEAAILDEDDDDTLSPASVWKQTSYLESMPIEILEMILSRVTVDHTADPYARPHVDLASCSLVCAKLYDAAVRVMYRHVSIPQSRAFSKLMRSLNNDKSLGELVHWLDFSHYSNMGFGKARTARNQTPFLKPETLLACLDMVPKLQAFLVHEHVDDELDTKIFTKLFSMLRLQALDLCACSSRPFTEAFTSVVTQLSTEAPLPNLKRISLHECTTLQEEVFDALLPRLTNLTHLDVAHTFINDAALLSIPPTARITHLNIERCTHLTGSAVVKFLTTHPAVKDSVVYLNLAADASRHRLLAEADVSKLLAALPPTLRSLNLNGARVNASHVPALRKLTTHVEELGLRGAQLSLGTDIKPLLKQPHAIRYLDLTDIKSVTQMSLSYSPSSLTDLDTLPLEVVELGQDVLGEVKRRNAHVKRPEWVVKELGRRGWFARQPVVESSEGDVAVAAVDDGSRAWKMGARWWGMRKVPVVEQDVGGMYGYFMFKRS
ncbi:hypothetical protein LTR96_004021 [Exophiala xenobiotica]|nr:hypothetical protein H2202_005250 [Exophiala xenobiotica]KAK5270743.1 hypothetical protein LTR96_004021 [Exophiala xenobiotica]KAK5331379.1 hypothetical protein LTR93_000382 [Exophiala xenobiotica]KAK5339633.1 hypothetical protein LTR98_004435 [Exophiala xenobiotica]KAK5415722.1 hypothetical protein LTR06_003772 [Exophiala xenobiotica]